MAVDRAFYTARYFHQFPPIQKCTREVNDVKQIKEPATTEEFDALFAAVQQSNMSAAQKATMLALIKSTDAYLLVDMLHLDEIPDVLDVGDGVQF